MFNHISSVAFFITMNTAKRTLGVGMVLSFLLVWQQNAYAKSYLAQMKKTGSEGTNYMKRNDSKGTYDMQGNDSEGT